jgi:hypothetical protein
MSDTATKLLIADFFGSFGPGCASRPVLGQIWLRRHDDLLVVYWEAQASLIDMDGAFWQNQGGGSRQRRKGSWQGFGGKTLALAPSGVRINRWCRNRGPGEGHPRLFTDTSDASIYN